MYPPAYPTNQNRHRKQRGQAYRYFHKRYRRQRSKILNRQKRRHRKLKNNGRYKRDRARRKEHPEKFLTKPSGGARTLSDRGKKQRKKKKSFEPIPYYQYTTGQWGLLLEVLPDGHVCFSMNGAEGWAWLEPFLDDVVIDELCLGRLETYLDQVFDYIPEGVEEALEDVSDPLFDAWVGSQVDPSISERALTRLADIVLADFMRDPRPPDMDSETVYDRANNHGEWSRSERERLEDISEYVSEPGGNPGSRVLPSGAGHVEKQAALMRAIEQGCSPALRTQGRGLAVKLRRVDRRNASWLFDVQGSKGPYRIKLQALRRGNVKAMSKIHVKVSCSCPFWQWQGPEHWAKKEDYLYGRARGSATKPSVKDPKGQHKACKHVLACFNWILSNKWQIPEPAQKRGSLHHLAHILVQSGVVVQGPSESSVERVVARYLTTRGV